jgi:hypothetical protein
VRRVPHHSVAVMRYGFGDDEKMLKQTRSKNECTGTCRIDNA